MNKWLYWILLVIPLFFLIATFITGDESFVIGVVIPIIIHALVYGKN